MIEIRNVSQKNRPASSFSPIVAVHPRPVSEVLVPLRESWLLVTARFVEEGLARDQARFPTVMDGIGSLFAGFIAVAPQRGGPVNAVFVDGVKIEMESVELLLVVFIVVGDTPEGFQACVRRGFPLAHHFDNAVPAANLDVFFALASGTRRAHFIVDVAARTDDWRITDASGNFPGQPGSRGSRRNVAF